MFETSRTDGVATLVLTHGKANALDLEFCLDVTRELAALEGDDVRALLVTARGNIFSAGVDLVRLTHEPVSYTDAFLDALHAMFEALFFFPRPVVVAINGHAVAGGCVMALAADHCLMAAGPARIGLAELAVGVPFPALVVEIARFALPADSYSEVMLSARTFTPDEALARGIVREVVEADALVERATGVARTWGAWRPEAFALTKRQMRAPVRERIASPWRGPDAQLRAVWKSEATRAAIREYAERTFKQPRPGAGTT